MSPDTTDQGGTSPRDPAPGDPMPGSPSAEPGSSPNGGDRPHAQILRTIEELQSRFEDLRRMHAEATQRETQLRLQAAQLTQRDETVAANARAIEQERARLTERAEGLGAREQELEARRVALEHENENLRGALAAAQQARTELERSRAQSVQSGAALEAQAARVSELEARLTELTSARLSLEARLTTQQASLDAAQRALEEAAARQQANPPVAAPESEELALRNRAIQVLAERLERAQKDKQDLQRQLDDAMAGAAPVPAAGTPNALRRQRLVRYKTLLRAQARKIMQAQVALQKRQAECEALLAQRARLAAAAADLTRREQRVSVARTKTTAATIVFYLVGITTILGALSWGLASLVAPQTYVAKAVLEVDPRGRTMTEQELASWQQYHQGLVSDPVMMEVAAERMARRGLATLGTAPDLGARLHKDLFTQSERPGMLTLELTGQGAERTERELSTFVAAMVAQANGSRDQRTDGGATLLTQDAKAGAEPIKDPRLPYAGAFLAGSLVAVLCFGLVIWARLARAKQRIDREDLAAATFEDPAWAAAERALPPRTLAQGQARP